MTLAYDQAIFARSIRYDSGRVPEGMKCYHGELLMACQSHNCQVDSGRMEKHSAANELENVRTSPDGKPCMHGMFRCEKGCWK